MTKRLIKLINNERLATKISAAKACDSTSIDTCSVTGYDNADCTIYSLDKCGKDYAACYEGADDICKNIDNNAPCHGAGQDDIT